MNNLRFSDSLGFAINQETSLYNHAQLVSAAEELSQRYREARSPDNQKRYEQPFLVSDIHRCAYLAVRLPATYAAIKRILIEIRNRMNSVPVQSVLDLGAGPGTAMWAAADVFPDLKKITLIEKDPAWIAMGQRLASRSNHASIQSALWIQGDLCCENSRKELSPHDLVILSYVTGELPSESLSAVVSQGWNAASQLLALIEPGTPHGFNRIRTARDILIAKQANLVAPCPHVLECPMQKGDWCHFSTRLERSDLHRAVKDVSLGFEDEKYSYVIGAKQQIALPRGRILRNPQRRSGHISFLLCTVQGVQHKVISRRDGETYKRVRKLEWGEDF
jgi:ribosomal protein RSM22 (predicted rRNA methylase)